MSQPILYKRQVCPSIEEMRCNRVLAHSARMSFVRIRGGFQPEALVQLNGDIFLFYNKSLGDLNVEKFTHQHPRRVDGVDDVWHAYLHSPRHLYDVGIARKLDWRLYKRLF